MSWIHTLRRNVNFRGNYSIFELAKGVAKPFKTDYLKKEVWYTLEGSMGTSFNLSIKEIKDIIQKNKRGIKPEINSFEENLKEENKMEVKLDERIDRFDKKKSDRNRNRKRKNFKSKRRGPKFEVKKN